MCLSKHALICSKKSPRSSSSKCFQKAAFYPRPSIQHNHFGTKIGIITSDVLTKQGSVVSGRQSLPHTELTIKKDSDQETKLFTLTYLCETVISHQQPCVARHVLSYFMQSRAVFVLLVPTQGHLHHLVFAEEKPTVWPLFPHRLEETSPHVLVGEHDDVVLFVDGITNALDDFALQISAFPVRLRQVHYSKRVRTRYKVRARSKRGRLFWWGNALPNRQGLMKAELSRILDEPNLSNHVYEMVNKSLNNG